MGQWTDVARRVVTGLDVGAGELVLVCDGAGRSEVLTEFLLAIEEQGATPLPQLAEWPRVSTRMRERAVTTCQGCCLTPVARVELAKDVSDMAFDGPRAYREETSDFGVREVMADERQHLPLPWGQGGDGVRLHVASDVAMDRERAVVSGSAPAQWVDDARQSAALARWRWAGFRGVNVRSEIHRLILTVVRMVAFIQTGETEKCHGGSRRPIGNEGAR